MDPLADIESLLQARGIPMRLPLAQAQMLIATALVGRELGVERVELASAAGRHLAADLAIDHALPGFDNSAMDGYAYSAAAATERQSAFTLRCVGESRAGARYSGQLAAGQCVRISTGAVMPAGADTVVMQEHTARDGDQVQVLSAPAPGANVRRAGEECAAGSRLLARGTRLHARGLSLAATAGSSALRVLRQPRVAILSGGDELVAPGGSLQPGQIYDSNSQLLAALVAEAGGRALPVAAAQRDDLDGLLDALTRCASAADLILTTGGASVGDHDHLPALLLRHGCVHFWKIQLKPGMPALFGELAGKPVLALPGNPVSAYITFRALAWPAIRALLGLPPPRPRRWLARLEEPLMKRHPRGEHLRGSAWIDAQGQCRVRALQGQESHRVLSLAAANVILPLPEGPAEWPAGALVAVESIALEEADDHP